MKRCPHCGSRNHGAFDCTKQDQTYTPTAEELAADEAERKARTERPKVQHADKAVVKVEEVLDPADPFAPSPIGGPAICRKAWLSSHASEQAAKDWHDHVAEGFIVRKVFHCDFCQGWHVDGSGERADTSGKRLGHYPRPGFTPFVRQETYQRSCRQDAERLAAKKDDLPKQAPPKDEPKKKNLDPGRVIPHTAKRDGDLF